MYKIMSVIRWRLETGEAILSDLLGQLLTNC